MHNKVLRAKTQRASLGRKQERAFRNNPWKFAKAVCDEPSITSPTFSQATCFQHYKRSFSDSEVSYEKLPDWVNQVSPPPEECVPFDLSAITPHQVKRTLQKCSSSSSPGHDEITYFHFRNLPCTHHFMATLFTKIFLTDKALGSPQKSLWSTTVVIPHNLIISDQSHSPLLFRKPSKIIANRLERYLLENNVINSSLQKGFLSGVNGTVEHTFAITSILDNAIQHGLPLALTFLDLKNAFGSIANPLIRDMLYHIKLPTQVLSHIMDGYSKLSASVKTKNWTTPRFNIKRSVFQGDTLSPLIFLVAFNPLIEVCNNLSTCGFSLRLPIPNSSGIPPVDSAIYVKWDEVQSAEPPGWYYAVVSKYHLDGDVTIEYANKGTERLNLNSVEWKHTRKGQKSFLPFSKAPPIFPLRKIRHNAKEVKYGLSSSHTVKAFTDDLSVFSSNISNHQSLLTDFPNILKN